ncbi:MAG: zinc-ribbon domain-containing protein [Bacilli bacterium]|nr:zinc-ribbon domain-containing protein [Bacilli bacterium]
MKSIKPGRGPSRNSGVMGIFAALFGVFWTIIAVSMGAFIMIPFGLIFIGVAIYQAVYNFRNAKSKNRHSLFDITEDGEEPDPLNEQYGINHTDYEFDPKDDSNYCPYCGNKVKDDYTYCNDCGKKLPK